MFAGGCFSVTWEGCEVRKKKKVWLVVDCLQGIYPTKRARSISCLPSTYSCSSEGCSIETKGKGTTRAIPFRTAVTCNISIAKVKIKKQVVRMPTDQNNGNLAIECKPENRIHEDEDEVPFERTHHGWLAWAEGLPTLGTSVPH